jgi:hypothetical protein
MGLQEKEICISGRRLQSKMEAAVGVEPGCMLEDAKAATPPDIHGLRPSWNRGQMPTAAASFRTGSQTNHSVL